jgi:hypothetical protein
MAYCDDHGIAGWGRCVGSYGRQADITVRPANRPGYYTFAVSLDLPSAAFSP